MNPNTDKDGQMGVRTRKDYDPLSDTIKKSQACIEVCHKHCPKYSVLQANQSLKKLKKNLPTATFGVWLWDPDAQWKCGFWENILISLALKFSISSTFSMSVDCPGCWPGDVSLSGCKDWALWLWNSCVEESPGVRGQTLSGARQEWKSSNHHSDACLSITCRSEQAARQRHRRTQRGRLSLPAAPDPALC